MPREEGPKASSRVEELIIPEKSVPLAMVP